MKVFEGHSFKTNAREAVGEATEHWPAQEAKPDLVLVFCSTKQDPVEIAVWVSSRFPDSIVAGCTTSGEILGNAHHNGAVVLAGIVSPEIRWTTVLSKDIASFDRARAQALSDELLAGLGVQRDDLNPSKHFCLAFIDGLSLMEETISSLMADALEGIPLVGGSAGDDLLFTKTQVLCGGEASSGAAVFLLGESRLPFQIIKHQHYTTTPRSLVITKADVKQRRVYEMDGYPAIEGYSRALGLRPSDVTADVTFLNPLTFVCNGEIYVRSVQRVEPDGSMVFYCAVEEGMVLSIGGHESMEEELARDLATASREYVGTELFIACNCILRALEASKGKHHGSLGQSLAKYSRHVIGFDTYGEQLNGLNINQTLVGIAFGGEPRSGRVTAS